MLVFLFSFIISMDNNNKVISIGKHLICVVLTNAVTYKLLITMVFFLLNFNGDTLNGSRKFILFVKPKF